MLISIFYLKKDNGIYARKTRPISYIHLHQILRNQIKLVFFFFCVYVLFVLVGDCMGGLFHVFVCKCSLFVSMDDWLVSFVIYWMFSIFSTAVVRLRSWVPGKFVKTQHIMCLYRGRLSNPLCCFFMFVLVCVCVFVSCVSHEVTIFQGNKYNFYFLSNSNSSSNIIWRKTLHLK